MTTPLLVIYDFISFLSTHYLIIPLFNWINYSFFMNKPFLVKGRQRRERMRNNEGGEGVGEN